jgi:NADPH:quinone reductase-like Zn-dependent oxidoreductase
VKAALNTRYGSPDVLEICEVQNPEPKAGEVLIRIHATTVSRTDCGMLEPHPFFIRFGAGLLRPNHTILGMDFSGEVAAIGAGVTTFKPGERVFGMSPEEFGSHAEYLCIPEEGPVAAMPAGLDFDEIVACEGAWYANNCLKGLGLKPGHKILIYGGSGAIGTAAVQLAKSYGAQVTSVVAPEHINLVKSLGADHAIDYTTQDLSQLGETYDCVLDAVGKISFFRCRQLLKPNAIFATTDLGPWYVNALLAIWSSITGKKRVIIPFPKNGTEFVGFLKARIEAGEFRAVVDRKYPLEEIADAYRYVQTGQKTGIVVIDVVDTQGQQTDGEFAA